MVLNSKSLFSGRVVMAYVVPILFISAFIFHQSMWIDNNITIPHNAQFTIRVNTFRRNDLLEQFLEHYSECGVVKETQVVWSDQENDAPLHWLSRYPKNKVVFEIHKTNSLNNRFKKITPVHTEAVLSIDDDLIIPCDSLKDSFQVWKANKRALVGFSPRMNAFDSITGHARYLRWQHTWWTGLYSIILTKVAFLHQDYLDEYFNVIPTHFLEYIDAHRNCEDIAMAYVIAVTTGQPPVWVTGKIHETSSSGISSGKDHFIARGRCLDELSMLPQSASFDMPAGTVTPVDGGIHDATNERQFVSSSKPVWKTGYQKYVYFSTFDAWKLFWDPK